MTLPSGLKTGFSSASFSSVELGRGPSSAETTVPSSFVYGVISRSKKPAPGGDGALLRPLREAVHVLAGDVVRSATFSAVMPIGM